MASAALPPPKKDSKAFERKDIIFVRSAMAEIFMLIRQT